MHQNRPLLCVSPFASGLCYSDGNSPTCSVKATWLEGLESGITPHEMAPNSLSLLDSEEEGLSPDRQWQKGITDAHH